MDKLAINGGPKLIKEKLRPYNSIGLEEIEAVKRTIESGVLSKYLGCWDDDFFGGTKVQEFEENCKDFFGVEYAITVNSWTSGLIAAVGAIGVEPGDEIIVSPWTMCASATAIIHWNAIPVFADIKRENFCIDPASIEKLINKRTKAIMAVDIFGQSADMNEIMELADKYNLKVISDSAQAPGALYRGKYTGTLAHIGGYSLNYHKHIHTGEGGVLVTNDSNLANKMRLIRNHAEAVVGNKGESDLTNMVGYNFRLGEIECAIGIEQLKKLKKIVENRTEIANRIIQSLSDLKGVYIPKVDINKTHVYYILPIILDVNTIGVTRAKIVAALAAEGLQGVIEGYANLHLLPMYQNKIAYGSKGFPWKSEYCRSDVDYTKGICPIAEKLHNEEFMGIEICRHELNDHDVELVISAFKKVWSNLDYL